MAAQRRKSQKKFDITKALEILLELIRDITSVIAALDSLPGFRLSSNERSSVARFKGFMRGHATRLMSGQETNENQLFQTQKLAEEVFVLLDEHFDSFMLASFGHFDTIMASIRLKSPQLLECAGDNIAELQANLRSAMANENASYPDIIEAYNAVNRLLIDLDRTAVEAEYRAREEKRKAKRSAIAADVLRALDALEV